QPEAQEECENDQRPIRPRRGDRAARAQDCARAASACAAVITATSTRSCTEQPRETSLQGLRRPCMIGPIAAAPPSLSVILYAMLPALMSGKTSTFASPASGLSG